MLFIVFRKLGRSMKCDTRQTETGLRVFWYVNTACDPPRLSTIWPLTLIYSAEQKISTMKQSKCISRFHMKDIRIHHHHDHYLCPCCLFVWRMLQSTIRLAVLAGCYGDTARHLCLFPSLSHARNAIPKGHIYRGRGSTWAISPPLLKRGQLSLSLIKATIVFGASVHLQLQKSSSVSDLHCVVFWSVHKKTEKYGIGGRRGIFQFVLFRFFFTRSRFLVVCFAFVFTL